MKEQKLQKLAELIKNDEEVFLGYLKSRFPLFYNSNFFFRDLEYGIKFFLEKKNINASASDILYLTEKTAEYLEQKKYFMRIRDGVWTVNLPQYATTQPGDPF